jgi:hypothetical protein
MTLMKCILLRSLGASYDKYDEKFSTKYFFVLYCLIFLKECDMKYKASNSLLLAYKNVVYENKKAVIQLRNNGKILNCKLNKFISYFSISKSKA